MMGDEIAGAFEVGSDSDEIQERKAKKHGKKDR
jgi:hypothetical protein